MRKIILILCLCLSCIARPTSTPRATTAPPTILIGVYMQPPSSFQKWKDRGCNLIVTDKTKPDSPAETPALRTAYFKAASDLGMRIIIGPDPLGAANDLSKTNLLAWSQPDEPEGWGHVVKNPDGSFNWKATTDAYQLQYRHLHDSGPNIPVYGNFSGGPLLSAREASTDPRNVTLPTYRDFAQGADWLAADFYVRPQGRPTEQMVIYGKVQDQLQAIAPGKPTYAVVECCDQGLTNGMAPTVSEFKAAIWIAMIHGAKGVIYFPLKVRGGFSFDNTPADIATAMQFINAELQTNADFFVNGQRVKGDGESAVWTMDNKSTLKASVTFANGVWTVKVDRNIVVVDPEKEALKVRIKRIDEWYSTYPH